ncbi:MAG: hypothetical protein JXR76_08590 [Deltaproteobacteria bacterium]|nr:hypothetical protein [Deltaproteobacteria bacterium]
MSLIPEIEYTSLANGQCGCARYEETPSHRGFDGLATHLASHGFIVVSINANLGIFGDRYIESQSAGYEKDKYKILTRGRLVLKHLAYLRDLHDGTVISPDMGTDLFGKIDFRHVGFIGHSRGGEGLRAAQYLYEIQDPDSYASRLNDIVIPKSSEISGVDVVTDLVIRGFFEFAPSNFGLSHPDATNDTPSPFNAIGIPRIVVVGTCDSDMRDYRGVVPFVERRTLDSSSQAFSSVFTIPGADHNSFNSEWKPDNYTCTTTAWNIDATEITAIQQQLARKLVTAFAKGFLSDSSDHKTYQNVFDSRYPLPDQLDTMTPYPMVRESIWHHKTRTATLGDAFLGSAGVDETEKIPDMNATGNERRLRHIGEVTSGDTYSALFAGGSVSSSTAASLSISVAPYIQRNIARLQEPIDFGVQLIGENGAIYPRVNVSNYVRLDHRINTVIGCTMYGEPYGDLCRINWKVKQNLPDVDAAKCSFELTKQPDCVNYEVEDTNGDGEGICYLYCKKQTDGRYRLFDQISIPLSDFHLPDNQKITGLRFLFDASQEGNLFLDKTVTFELKPARGDVNGDSQITAVDALMVARHYLGLTVSTPFDVDSGDVNCDGKVTISDAELIANFKQDVSEAFKCDDITPFDPCHCNTGKCADCTLQLRTCDVTPGCAEIVQCTYENPCRFAHKDCYNGLSCHQITGLGENSAAGRAANDVFSCMGGC